MPNIFDWSGTPGSNNSASPNGWPEGMPPSGVNDSARQMMAETAKWRDLISGAKTTSGTDTITLTSGATITSYTGLMFVAKLGGTNTGAATINIDSVGAAAVEIDGAAVSAGDLASGKYYQFVYDGTAFQLTRLSSAVADAVTAASNGGAAVASGAVSVDPNNATDTAIAAGDEILFADADDSNNVKKDTVQGILDLASSTNPNTVINGDMRIAQRGTVSSISGASYGGPDRFQINLSGASNFTLEQSSDAPANTAFQNSLRLTVGTGDALGTAADFVLIRTMFEGQDLAQFKKGTTNAESMTLTFWARSAVTGTHIVRFRDHDNSRAISGSYSIAVADTWEFQTITVAGDTTGAFGDDNGRSFALEFFVGAGTNYTSGTLSTSWAALDNVDGAVGQVNGVATTSNIFALTGVKLEVGATATDFVPDDYATSLAKCQRYYEQIITGEAVGIWRTAAIVDLNWTFKVTKRTTPTLTLTSTAPRVLEPAVANRTATGSAITVYSVGGGNANVVGFSLSGFSSANIGTMAISNHTATGIVTANAEL